MLWEILTCKVPFRDMTTPRYKMFPILVLRLRFLYLKYPRWEGRDRVVLLCVHSASPAQNMRLCWTQHGVCTASFLVSPGQHSLS